MTTTKLVMNNELYQMTKLDYINESKVVTTLHFSIESILLTIFLIPN